LTAKNYRSDFDAFAAWFEGANGEPMEPAKITPTDLRQFKRWLVEQRRLKPNTVNRKLATLKSFLTWATQAGLTSGLPVPAPGQAWSGPRPVAHEQPGPRWLDRREQNALLRAVERSGRLRDLAVVRLLLNTGLRVQELCALTWKDVALSERKGLLTVRHGSVEGLAGMADDESAAMALARSISDAIDTADIQRNWTKVASNRRPALSPLISFGQALLDDEPIDGLDILAIEPHLIAQTILDAQDEAGETTMSRDVLARMFDDFYSITDEELADLCTA